MKKPLGFALLVILLALAAGLTQAQGPGRVGAQSLGGGPATTAGSAFTYQGQLRRAGSPVNDSCAMQFALYDAASAGVQVGPTVSRSAVQVAEGLFTIPDLDFGAVFTGDARWLEIAVQCSGDAGFTTLAPRQELTPAPYAQGVPWSGVSAMPAGFADGVDDEGVYTAGIGLTLVGSEFALAGPYQVPQGCNAGEIPEWNAGAGAWQCGVDDIGTGGGGGDITAVYAGEGLTGGGEIGSVTLYADPTYLQRRVGETCAAGSAIREINQDGTVACEPAGAGDHDHWGQSWSGSGTGLALASTDGNGLQVSTAAGNGRGLYVQATATTGFSYGLYAVADSTYGRGVYGYASATAGQAYGVWGETSSTEGTGVLGYATATSGGIGVRGEAASSNGWGVWGYATATAGPAFGVTGQSNSTNGRGVFGTSYASTGTTYGVHGLAASTNGTGVYGQANATSGSTYGVYGKSNSSSGFGVYGEGPVVGVSGTASSTTHSSTVYGVYGRITNGGAINSAAVAGWNNVTAGTGYGVYARTESSSGYAVFALAPSTTGTTYALFGRNVSSVGYGVYGDATATGDTNYGVYGKTASTAGYGVYGSGPTYGLYGDATATSGSNYGVLGRTASTGGIGVRGTATSTTGTNYGVYGWINSPGSYAVYGRAVNSTSNYAGYFSGNVNVTGNLSKGGGSFKIDHPLDPANRYLYHSFVESPDMLNLYNGVVTLGADGTAWVTLPDWFEALNRDYRYQLTCIGAYAPVYVATKIEGQRFRIAGGTAGLEVSWQVTGIRQDPYANAHRIPVEELKPAAERGTYLYPELYGQPLEMGLDYQREQQVRP